MSSYCGRWKIYKFNSPTGTGIAVNCTENDLFGFCVLLRINSKSGTQAS